MKRVFCPVTRHAEEDVFVTVRDAFDTARRVLDEDTRIPGAASTGSTDAHDPRAGAGWGVRRRLRRFVAA
jgi:hypothetical protein